MWETSQNLSQIAILVFFWFFKLLIIEIFVAMIENSFWFTFVKC